MRGPGAVDALRWRRDDPVAHLRMAWPVTGAEEFLMDNDKLRSLLSEMRDAQLRFNDEYRRIASESLAIQRQSLELQQGAVAQQKIAVEAQARHLRLYRRVLGVSAVVVLAIVVAVVLLIALR
jgi:anti-sigma-K factor RskA